MAKKIEKKISVNAFEKAAKPYIGVVNTVEWEGIEIQIKKHISLTDMLELVDGVVSSCFLDDGTYMPELLDFAFNRGVLMKYTSLTMPADASKCYDLIVCSGIMNAVFTHIDMSQYYDIEQAIEDKIDHLCDSRISMVQSQLNEVAESFNNMQEKVAAVFSGVTASDIQKLAGSSFEESLDASKVVAAYLEQTKGAEGE